MARIRSIHPGFFTDEAVVSVSPIARICIIGLGIEADDKGIFEWKPLMLKMRLFPADNISMDDILNELSAANLVINYEMEGRQYGAIRNFRKFQRPKTPNDIHPMPDEIENYVGLNDAISEKKKVKEVPFPQKGEKSLQMEDGGCRMEDRNIEPKGSRASGDALQGEDEGDQDEDGDKLLPKHVVEKWNEIAPTLGKPCVRDLTPERRQNLKARIAQYAIEDFLQVFDNISNSPFLRGDTGKNFCNFDWAMKKANFQKILEGNYNNG